MDVEVGGGVAVSVVVRAEAVVAKVSDWEYGVFVGGRSAQAHFTNVGESFGLSLSALSFPLRSGRSLHELCQARGRRVTREHGLRAGDTLRNLTGR